MFSIGCSGSTEAHQPQTRELSVFAAASLKETFSSLKKTFESTHPGVRVVLDFAGSQTLALQINNGAPCDVFASADMVQMKMAEVRQRIDPKDVLQFASNRLVVVANSRSNVARFQDLAKHGLKLLLADAKVPAGEYARLCLDKAGAGFAKEALQNVVSEEQDVRAVLTKVELGEADAGIIYRTDSMVATNSIRVIEIPSKDSVESDYYIAPVEGNELSLAKDFVSFVMSPQGQNVLARAGFLVTTK